MMLSVSAGCLLALSDDAIPVVVRSVLPRFAPRRLVFPPRLIVSGDGEPAGLLACLVMSCLRREA